MSIARPTNRNEFRQYILTKLGAPVIEINVAKEQIDLAIEDAFQYFNERSHFLGTENLYLTTRMTAEFVKSFESFRVQEQSQTGTGKEPIPGRSKQRAVGMVEELVLVSPGEEYPGAGSPQAILPTTEESELEITTDSSEDIQTDAGDNIVYETTGSKTGKGLTVVLGEQRTVKMGITNVSIYNCGENYEVGDIIAVGGNLATKEQALFQVSKVKTESDTFGSAVITTQNNYLVLPDDVVGVLGVMRSVNTDLIGIFPGGSVFPVLLGGMLGNDTACGDMGYDLVSYVSMREYMATLEFLFFPPIQYSFNQRTHRLFIDSNKFGTAGGAYGGGTVGKILAIDAMVKPSPDVYPDLWNDLWLKKYATSLVKAQWGRNLTKFNSVNLPGGITMNGDQILQQGNEEIAKLEERFAMDWADPCLDMVG